MMVTKKKISVKAAATAKTKKSPLALSGGHVGVPDKRTTTRRLEDIECDLTLIKNELKVLKTMMTSLGAKTPDVKAESIHEHSHEMHMRGVVCDGGG
jgi:hypothetical protein